MRTELCLCGHGRLTHWFGGKECRTCKCKQFEPEKVDPDECTCTQAPGMIEGPSRDCPKHGEGELCDCGHSRSVHGNDPAGCAVCDNYHDFCSTFQERQEPPLSPEEEETVPEDPGRLQRALRAASEMKDALPAARRPPYSVNYAAGGRQFQVLLPGDCSVRAEDGALIIRHSEPVAAITDVAPWRG